MEMTRISAHATLSERLRALADEFLDARRSYQELVAEAAQLIKREQLFEDFFDAFGGRALYSVFRDFDHQDRYHAAAEQEWTKPGERKWVKATRKPDFLSLVFTVDGHRVRLGDMTLTDCQWIAHSYAQMANANGARGKFFQRLSATLKRTSAKTVADAYRTRVDALRQLYRTLTDE